MKVFAAVVVIVCVLAGWLYLRGGDGALTPMATAPVTPRDDDAAQPVVTANDQRREVGGEAELPKILVEAQPRARIDWRAAPEAWQVVIAVVDCDQRPVADAVVTDASSRDDGQQPLRTDADGRVRLALTRSWAEVSAAKDGQSSDSRHLSQREHADKVIELVLDGPVIVRGVVLSAAGVPVADAWVEAHRNGVSSATRRFDPPEPEKVRSDHDGRFSIGLWFGHGYSLTARRDGVDTLPEAVWLHDRQPHELMLRFPGAITLAGLVVDAAGVPVADATVRGWREVAEGGVRGDYELLKVTSDGDGAFSIAVKRHARYQLIASSDGRGSSEPVWFEPNEARPRATGTLRLAELATIAGVVEQDGGAPFVGVRVFATAMGRHGGHSIVEPGVDDRFGRPEHVTTGADGRFAIEVHPGTRWKLLAAPPHELSSTHVEVRDVAAGSRDVTIRITAADLAGCVVQGFVRRADGGEVAGYRVQVFHIHDDGSRSGVSQADASIDGSRFTVGPLSLGQQIGLMVSLPENGPAPAAAAPAYVGPFRTEGAALKFDFVLPQWAELPVRVVDASGEPAREVTVMFWSAAPMRGLESPQRVDERGVVVLQRRSPGHGTLYAFGQSKQLLAQEVTLTSGRNAEVVLRLPESSVR